MTIQAFGQIIILLNSPYLLKLSNLNALNVNSRKFAFNIYHHTRKNGVNHHFFLINPWIVE